MNQIKPERVNHHRLLQRQIKKATAEGGAIDYDVLLDLVNAAYNEHDHNRTQHDRALSIMSMEMMEQNEELRRHRKNLEELVDKRTKEFMDAREKAEAAAQAKTDFITNMSHEIRAPLNGIIGVVDILANTELSHEQKNLVQIIKKSAGSLLEIINDVLDITEIEAGRFSLEHIDFSLYSCIEDITTFLMFRAQEQGIDLLVDFAPNVPDSFVGDAGRIRQIILNLLSNAIKFTSSGYVVMRVSAQDLWGTSAQLHFEIEDTGIGISEEKLDYIFNKFSQTEEATAHKFAGTGLGLAICKYIIKSMNGSIHVRSILGKGSVFSFDITLPYSKNPSIDSAISKEKIYPSVDLNKLRALVVDNMELNLKILGKYMEKLGIKQSVAISAATALNMLLQAEAEGNPYNLLFVDRRVADVERVSIAKIIRENPKLSETALVLVSGTRDDNIASPDALLAEGFIGFLAKPYYPLQLKNIVLMVVNALKCSDTSQLITANTTPPALSNPLEKLPVFVNCEECN